MLVLNPQSVVLLGKAVEHVRRVSVRRSAERVVLEWGNAGPYPVFADVPEQRVELEVLAELHRGSIDGPTPGEEGTLSFFTSPTAGSGGREKVVAQVVVLGVSDEVAPGGTAQRRIRLAAISADGTQDPIDVSNAEDGQR
ncbi:MAG: hypothetical protein KatS3mg103_1117 [Phycisphaerales bacterium]|nr:MAG: hypothetical protein KatS3mg103_1117 [Phycisphaerales bacterium]